MISARRLSVLAPFIVASFALGCDSDEARPEQAAIHQEHMPSVLRMVRRNMEHGPIGARTTADRIARGFLVEDEARREREIRSVLMQLKEPPRGIPEIMSSPISFIAAVGTDGRVIARDSDPDPMAGFDLAEAAPVVRRALEGHAGHELTELPTLDPEEPPSVTILFAAPARHQGRVVGAVVTGLPLWRMSQQFTNQIRLELGEEQRSTIFWAFLYRGEETHEQQLFPADLMSISPSLEDRRRSLEASPGGYTGQVQQFGKWYGYGVLPLPTLGEGVGVILWRSNS